MDNVRAAMARVASISSTIQGRVGTPGSTATPGSRQASAAAIQAAFAQAMAQVQSTGMPHANNTLGSVFGTQPYTPPWMAPLTPSAGVPRSGAPAGLEGYENGKIPPQALAPISGSDERLWAPAAAAFEHMRADAARAGVTLPVVDGYRSYEDQIRLASELGLYKEGGLAAVPGTSEHGWGRALDLELNDQGVEWMRNNAWKYGFVETVPREPWHWEFHPSTNASSQPHAHSH